MLELIFEGVRATAKQWRSEAAQRRKVHNPDPIAAALDYCAEELLLRVKQMEKDSEGLTVHQYARLKKCSPQTIRNWIRRGELRAERTPRGFIIPRAADRRRAS